MKANKYMVMIAVALALTGCGGGSSNKDDAPAPPAPEVPENPAPEVPGNPAPELPEAGDMDLTASCGKSPATVSIQSGAMATGNFEFNKPINDGGTVFMACQDLLAASGPITITSGMGSFSAAVPDFCIGANIVMTLEIDEAAASCSWNVTEGLDIKI
ncbi:MAG: hypothetical protein AAF402_03785 [Pseudomonadota bacterium]